MTVEAAAAAMGAFADEFVAVEVPQRKGDAVVYARDELARFDA